LSEFYNCYNDIISVSYNVDLHPNLRVFKFSDVTAMQ